MERVTIKKGFYWSAGHKYKWTGKYDANGFGIAMDILRNSSEIEVVVSGKFYTLDCQQAICFIKTYKSVEKYQGKNVGILTKTLLKASSSPQTKDEKSFPQPFLQNSLF